LPNYDFNLLRKLAQNPASSQRSLAKELNVSVGKVNYLLAGLAQKGLIKVKKLQTEPGTIRWNYILTPKGVKEKMEITKKYLQKRTKEFERLQLEIEELKAEVDE